jgi:hypothetical protein
LKKIEEDRRRGIKVEEDQEGEEVRRRGRSKKVKIYILEGGRRRRSWKKGKRLEEGEEGKKKVKKGRRRLRRSKKVKKGRSSKKRKVEEGQNLRSRPSSFLGLLSLLHSKKSLF